MTRRKRRRLGSATVSAAARYALVTLPAFRQRVQTYTRFGAPASTIRTFWTLTSKRRFVATIE